MSTPIVTTLNPTLTTLPAVLDDKALAQLGLKPTDVDEIQSIARQIDADNPLTVAQFGRSIDEHASGYADALLGQVQNRDLEDAGTKLNTVVNVARDLNMGALSDRRSRVPVIGTLIDRVRRTTVRVRDQFETAKTQIDHLVTEVDQTRTGLEARNTMLQTMFASVQAEHRLLGMHVAAGKLRLQELHKEVDALRASAQSPADVQRVADLDGIVANLDKRVANLQVLQHSALQTLPQIRLMQQNNQTLVDKFHTIRQITIPAWKRDFVLGLSLNEQKNAVELATHIDNTTNELLRRNAKLLHQNAVATAQSNARHVIDIDTLQLVQKELIDTVQDVIRIQQDGAKANQQVEQTLLAMRSDLQAKLTRATGQAKA
ncbi:MULTISPECIES: toxic anion resistance protein [Cupriavidus]